MPMQKQDDKIRDCFSHTIMLISSYVHVHVHVHIRLLYVYMYMYMYMNVTSYYGVGQYKLHPPTHTHT